MLCSVICFVALVGRSRRTNLFLWTKIPGFGVFVWIGSSLQAWISLWSEKLCLTKCFKERLKSHYEGFSDTTGRESYVTFQINILRTVKLICFGLICVVVFASTVFLCLLCFAFGNKSLSIWTAPPLLALHTLPWCGLLLFKFLGVWDNGSATPCSTPLLILIKKELCMLVMCSGSPTAHLS